MGSGAVSGSCASLANDKRHFHHRDTEFEVQLGLFIKAEALSSMELTRSVIGDPRLQGNHRLMSEHGHELEKVNDITDRILGAAIAVHRELGPGLLESAYEECLVYELRQRGLRCDRQVEIPIRYKAVVLRSNYRADLIVESCVVVELKCVKKIQPIDVAQLITYLKLSGCRVGLLLNYNTEQLVKGIKRIIMP